jgi:hypothetical protein
MHESQPHSWLQNLNGVDALAILTDADLLSHKNGHALFYDGVEALENECAIISADPDYFFENLVNVPLPSILLTVGSSNAQTHSCIHMSYVASLRWFTRTNHHHTNSRGSSRSRRVRDLHHPSDLRSETH